jgi:hypothetical protein
MARTHFPGIERFFSLRGSTLRTGIVIGAALSAVLAAWVLVANRIPQLDVFAFERNLAAVGVLLALAAVPACRFVKSPRALFISGCAAWALLTLAYMTLEIFFPRLESRVGPLQLFILGAVSYGVLAVLAWVVGLLHSARQQHVVAARRRPH